MSLPEIVSRDEWLAARTALLEQEKELTRRRDALSAERRQLPMVEITKDYRFTGPQGEVGLADLFEGRRQLIVYHFMFDPEWEDGCPSCSAGVDEMSRGLLDHLHTRDTTLAYVSRAPLEKLERWKAKKGWDFPWYSSHGSDFNYDFGVTIDDAQGLARTTTTARRRRAAAGGERAALRDAGPSVFLRVDDRVFHTYSPYARGPSRPAARTTSSTSPRSGARRTGRSPRAAPTARAPRSPTSRASRRSRIAAANASGASSGVKCPAPSSQRSSTALKNTSRRSDHARGKSGSCSCHSTVVGVAIRCSGGCLRQRAGDHAGARPVPADRGGHRARLAVERRRGGRGARRPARSAGPDQWFQKCAR